MASWQQLLTTSLHGQRAGLRRYSHGMTSTVELMAGPDGFRANYTTDASTGTNVASVGTHLLPGTSAGSSSVYTLDPPIPGAEVTLLASTRADAYVKTANGEYIKSTQASSDTVLKLPAASGGVTLIGISTAAFAALTAITSASGIVTSTST